jgi:transketolase
VVGRDDFGASAPLKDIMFHFGFTVDNVLAKARLAMSKAKS